MSIFKNHFSHWDKECLSKEKGCLGVRNLKVFNLHILGKWCWMLRRENDGFWY